MNKIQVYWTGLSLVMMCECTILILKTRDKACSGNILVPHKKRFRRVPFAKIKAW
jgi:hypothetical protein